MPYTKIITYRFFLFILLTAGIHAQSEFVLGEYTVKEILDGDTFRFDGLDRTTRLLGIDTEETFKKSDAEERTREIARYWTDYYAHKKDSSGKPAKIESPFGYGTWQWTKSLFDDVVKVRLESDDTNRTEDMYGRYLVYIFAVKTDGSEFNYNIECVKQGYSPYFNKYGNSARFHDAFTKAQEYAIGKMLGIWSGQEMCYPDYTERLKWWNKRAEQIEHFESTYSRMGGYYSLLDLSDYTDLKKRLGDTVIVFGSISRTFTDKEPHLAILEAGKDERLDLVFFAEHYILLPGLGLDNPKDYYIYAKGLLGEFNGRLQIIIEDASQVWRE